MAAFMTDTPSNATIAACILALVSDRAPKSICPSEAARALSTEEPEWRALMPAVRAVAAELADAGQIAVTQRGTKVDVRSAKGPIRLSASFPKPSR